jgi:ubiquitin C-terminal hydrolase
MESIQAKEIKYGQSKYKNIMGVSCYMNANLHILQNVPIFVEYITQQLFKTTILQKIKSHDDLKEFVIFELYRLFKVSLENDDMIITPSTFKELVGKKNDMWTELQHQDSQEFFNLLISQLEEEVGVKTKFIPGANITIDIIDTFDNSIRNIMAIKSWTAFQSREYSPLKNMFNGMIETNRRCSCCMTNNIVYEPFVTLGLSIPIKMKQDILKSFSIYDCLDHMICEDQLDSNNMMNCEMCGLKNQSFNKTFLWKTPKILVLHLKRFLVNSYGVTTQKLTNDIMYPIKDLDLNKYFDGASPYKNSCKYDLIGINLHQSFGFGKTINAGHYTSMVKNIMNNNWYLYNDSNDVKQIINKSHLQQENAYMLFYYRHD